jgi:hypothetical protein
LHDGWLGSCNWDYIAVIKLWGIIIAYLYYIDFYLNQAGRRQADGFKIILFQTI